MNNFREFQQGKSSYSTFVGIHTQRLFSAATVSLVRDVGCVCACLVNYESLSAALQGECPVGASILWVIKAEVCVFSHAVCWS